MLNVPNCPTCCGRLITDTRNLGTTVLPMFYCSNCNQYYNQPQEGEHQGELIAIYP